MEKLTKRKINNQSGAAMLIVVVFFLFISLAIISGLVSPTVRGFQNANVNLNSKRSYFLAESGIEDAIYRIKRNKTIGNSETIMLGANSTTTNVTTTGGNVKQVTSLGDVSSYQRKINVKLQTGEGIAFNYGLQAGNGGVIMDGGSKIIGNLYSNGSINAISATITGTAVAADSASLTADQANDTPTTPPSIISFRNVSAAQDFAQSFQVGSSSPINKIQFYIKKVGNPSDATIRLVADNAGSPSTSVISVGSAFLSAGQVSTNFGWVDVVLPTTPSLIPGTTYWVIVDNNSQSSSNYYVVGANTLYPNGTAKIGVYNGIWNNTSLDGYFRIFTGGIPSMIGGAGYVGGLVVGSAGIGDAWATTIKGTSVQGHLYCTNGTYNNKTCDNSRGTPPPQPMSFSEANISDWKNEALAGGTINGDYNVNWQGGTLGPKKITGNLVVNGGGTFTLTGTIWVQGNVTISGGGKMKLPANYASNSGTIVSDGLITIQGGGSLGSGTPGSYLFVVSTSECPNDIGCSSSSAISVTGGAGAIAVDAQYGNVALSGGATLNAAVGNSITMTGGTVVTYDQGLASPSFSSGPSGAWVVGSWGESQ